ncbi:MAG TPA: M1 family aminopeptidase [Terriglobales bacterium]|nr:M1 family aminopeptidase [Terriglobales bacterium]
MFARLSPLLLIATFAFAAAPPGVPRDLARQRAAEISNLRYRVSFVLLPHAATTAGHEELTFTLQSARPVLLDYRDGTVTTMMVNGSTVAATPDNGHLLLPAERLRAGENTLTFDFTSAVAPAGKPITRYEDKDDGSEYIYTLFVPMDASMAFPCFDQPDLKGRFQLEITAPRDWTVISNTEPKSSTPAGPGQLRTVFAETRPISTYLFAFAAGPFRKVERPGELDLPGLYARKSEWERAEKEAPEVQQIAKQGMAYLSTYFAQPFPFPKYDMVLIPGFPYGGMEHAGATFLREESVLFRTAPTHSDLLGRDLLVLHELTHQWFGDLTTMRWFDDLWLKEGFAQYMAYQALDALKPGENIWKRFYETIKPLAYEIDSTQGTTPIYQDIPNLKDAKSAYGAIVYYKAPGVLKQLAYVLGPEHFRDGLRLYLKEHLYGNAEWSDLVHAFERVSGEKLDRWADMWIRHRGMPQVDANWSCDDGRVSHVSLSQHDVLGEGKLWPIATEVLLSYGNAGPGIRFRATFDTATANFSQAAGKPCPQYIFANNQDYAYGRFLLDTASRVEVVRQLGDVRDLFRRALLWGSLWESVRVADLAPRRFVALAQLLLRGERDELLLRSTSAHTLTALHRYVSPATRAQFVPAFEAMADDRMLHSTQTDLRILWFRVLRALAETPAGRSDLKNLLNGKISVPGVELRPLDRWNLVTALMALNDPEADAYFRAEQQRDHTGDGLKYAYVAEAARPDSKTKQKYFEDYLHDPSRPEDWIEESLDAFNYWNQSSLTQPYLKPALDALPQIKRERKIFFLLDWLEAFIGGQQSPAAQAEVHDFLRTADPDRDLRLKILQTVDELDRTVKIRQKFPE